MTFSRRRFARHPSRWPQQPQTQRVAADGGEAQATSIPAAVAALRPFPGTAVPITDDERRARIEKARRLMAEHGFGAIVLEPGTSMRYSSGVSWGTSERPFLLVIPAKGELAYVAPGFEEARAREVTRFTDDVRVWQEDEDWGATVAGILRDRGVSTGTIGIEERVRFFIAEGLRTAAPASRFVLATPVTAGCRMIKSPAEIALMQRANDMTHRRLPRHVRITGRRDDALRGRARSPARRSRRSAPQAGRSRCSGKYSAFPHGTITPQRLKRGDIVLMDGGCTVEGYESDITRTTVFGTPSKRQIDVWNLEKNRADCRVHRRPGRRHVRIGRCGGADRHHARRIRTRLQGARAAAPHRPRHRDGRPRVDEFRARQYDRDRTGDVLQR